MIADDLTRAVLANPDDLAPRLMLADHAAEQGDTMFETALRHPQAPTWARLFVAYVHEGTAPFRDYRVWVSAYKSPPPGNFMSITVHATYIVGKEPVFQLKHSAVMAHHDQYGWLPVKFHYHSTANFT